MPGDPRAGRLGLPEDIRRILKARRGDILLDLTTICKLTVPQLDRVLSNPRSTAIQASIAAVLKRSIDQGDAKCLNVILDRILGRSREAKRTG